jgi:hypothetical protein
MVSNGSTDNPIEARYPVSYNRIWCTTHWIHIRSSNVIESSFATVRHNSERRMCDLKFFGSSGNRVGDFGAI